jgi:predicted hydrolase (HD superfamily)
MRHRALIGVKSLLHHARAIELVMARSANAYGDGAPDEMRFRIAGLLHDADYERFRTASRENRQL